MKHRRRVIHLLPFIRTTRLHHTTVDHVLKLILQIIYLTKHVLLLRTDLIQRLLQRVLLQRRHVRTFGETSHTFLYLEHVLIVGLNLVGYVAFRLLRADRGAVLAGVLGGLISSTATTVSFAGMTRHNASLAAGAALIVLIASTVVYGRVAVELLLVAPDLLDRAAAPMGTFALVMLAAAAVIYPRVRRRTVAMPELVLAGGGVLGDALGAAVGCCSESTELMAAPTSPSPGADMRVSEPH